MVSNDHNYVKEIDKIVKSFDNMKIVNKENTIRAIIKELGFLDVNDTTTRISKESFDNNREKIINDYLEKNDSFIKPLFGKGKSEAVSNKKFMGFVNSLFGNYGFSVNTNQTTTIINKKQKCIYYYTLQFDENIIQYL
jgi:hypothetical protein